MLDLLPILCGLFGIVFGIVALGRGSARASGQAGGMAIAGIVCGGFWAVAFAAGAVVQAATQR